MDVNAASTKCNLSCPQYNLPPSGYCSNQKLGTPGVPYSITLAVDELTALRYFSLENMDKSRGSLYGILSDFAVFNKSERSEISPLSTQYK